MYVINKASEAVKYFGSRFGDVANDVSSRGMGSSQMMENRLENSFTNLGADIMRVLANNGFVVGEDIKYSECGAIQSFDLGNFNVKRRGIENICVEVAGFMQAFQQEKAHFRLLLKDNVVRQVDGIIKHEVIPVFSGLIASTVVDITEVDKRAARAVLGAGNFIKNKLFPGHDAQIAEQRTSGYTAVGGDEEPITRPKTEPKAKTAAKSTAYNVKNGPTKENIAAYLENNPDEVEKRFGIAKDEINDGVIDKLAAYVASKWQELKVNAAASKHKKVDIGIFPDEWVDFGARWVEKAVEQIYSNTNEDQQAAMEDAAEKVLDVVLSSVDVKGLSDSLKLNVYIKPHTQGFPYKKSGTLDSNSANVWDPNKIIHEDAGYHHSGSAGRKSPAAKDPDAAARNSVKWSEDSSGRIGVDRQNKEIVILRYSENKPDPITGERKDAYHNHIVKWEDLADNQRAALRDAKLVKKNGRIK